MTSLHFPTGLNGVSTPRAAATRTEAWQSLCSGSILEKSKESINRKLSSKILKIRVTTCKESKQTDVMPLQVQLHMDWGAVPSCRTGGQ